MLLSKGVVRALPLAAAAVGVAGGLLLAPAITPDAETAPVSKASIATELHGLMSENRFVGIATVTFGSPYDDEEDPVSLSRLISDLMDDGFDFDEENSTVTLANSSRRDCLSDTENMEPTLIFRHRHEDRDASIRLSPDCRVTAIVAWIPPALSP